MQRPAYNAPLETGVRSVMHRITYSAFRARRLWRFSPSSSAAHRHSLSATRRSRNSSPSRRITPAASMTSATPLAGPSRPARRHPLIATDGRSGRTMPWRSKKGSRPRGRQRGHRNRDATARHALRRDPGVRRVDAVGRDDSAAVRGRQRGARRRVLRGRCGSGASDDRTVGPKAGGTSTRSGAASSRHRPGCRSIPSSRRLPPTCRVSSCRCSSSDALGSKARGWIGKPARPGHFRR